METTDAVIRAAFPEQPVPKTFFAVARPQQDDAWLELACRIEGRVWTSVSLLDWRMTGGSPSANRLYMIPETFAYYVPSFLVGAISEPGFRDLAYEAILPHNRYRVPRGEWWARFESAFTGPQRTALRAFLAFQRKAASFTFDMVDEELVGTAEKIWA